MLNSFLRGVALSLTIQVTPLFAQSSVATCTTLHAINIPEHISQIVLTQPINTVQAHIYLCQKTQGTWHMLPHGSFPAVIGKGGLAAVGEKKEGDLKTPEGFYAIGEAFGMEPLALKMDYKYITPGDKFIDDVNHSHYNQWVFGATDAQSYESMLIPLYKYGAIIRYNMHPTVPGLGSGIFLHIWRSSHQGTAGCVAMAENNLLLMLQWLDKNQHPYIKILSPAAGMLAPQP
ncbi:MAG: hypothetical protein CK424_04165 [Legionella sp.]|nr:MAG: hypothetical protein CK424_04165 [Legionella sp.]